MSDSSTNKESHKNLIESFQAYLHVIITAGQSGQSGRLAALPGAKTADYCAALAKLPGNTLAGELARPVLAILHQIEEAAMDFDRPLYQKKIIDPQKKAEYERILWQLDFALALIMRVFPSIVRFRANSTKCSDLICEAIGVMNNGWEAAQLIRRYEREFPEGSRNEDGTPVDGGSPGQFAWDAYQRIEALDKLADEFPELIRIEARHMHGWPMLVHRHTTNKRRFRELAARLELGEEYPLDVSEGARFRPDTPLVRYLDPRIYRVHHLWCNIRGIKYESVEEENRLIDCLWWQWPEEKPGDELLKILRMTRRLPPFTKATAIQWAEKAVVPLIMVSDARDWKNCTEPVLERIARQRGVKSEATFKSRLLAAVSATLRRLARPA